MKKCLLKLVLSLVLAITWGGEGFAQTKKEMTFSGTYYWSGTPKVFQVDLVQSIRQLELFGVRLKDHKADKKAAKKEEQQWATNTVNEYGPKLKPIWEAVLQAGQERVKALRNMGITDTQMKVMYNIDPTTGFHGKELLFLSRTTSRGGWGRTWKGGGGGRYPPNDSYDSNMVSNLLIGKITSENLQKFIRIFDVNSQRYVNPRDYMENKKEYDAEIKSGNAFLDQFANSRYAPSDQDESIEKQYGFGVLMGEDVYQPFTSYFTQEQVGLLQPLFEQQWASKVEAYYAKKYALQRQQAEWARDDYGRR
jgi:hypothetical protein